MNNSLLDISIILLVVKQKIGTLALEMTARKQPRKGESVIMNDLTKLFSTKEIKEITLFKETCPNIVADEGPVKCFTVLSDILTHRVKISDIPSPELMAIYAQLKLLSTTWRKIEWLDHKALAKITPKVKTLITIELKRRESE